ncbi:MinD/ParA family protein [Neobacillus niacini]|uniref:MinD/ParA family protein n=1 Tax=Neobacillus niacini TaxID=86668 RepID=UPI0007AB2C50|nr:MinD/ParA family protein [Neobacillus niacini]MEC1522185.1 MinD/ParA family protein [Neobacillus niacini]
MKQDQAHQLRHLSNSLVSHERTSRVVTIASGKGGVGKSNFTLSFALSLMELGKKVVVIDLDIGMANLDILMGATPKQHLWDMIRERKSIWSVLEKGPGGLEYIAGGSGFQQLLQLKDEERQYFFQELEKLHGYADIILIDTGAGLTVESQQCHLSADEIILLTTPEPTAIADAYSVIKILHSQNPALSFQLVVNRVSRQKEGIEVASKVKLAVQSFLKKEIKIFGAIPDDAAVTQAVLKQVPFYIAFPRSPASVTLRNLAERFVTGSTVSEDNKGIKGFIRNFSRLLRS